MKIFNTEFLGIHKVQHFSNGDTRGCFVKPWFANGFGNQFGDLSEIYCTKSKKGVLRGLHYQTGVHAQKKYVTCLDGIVEDIALDLRRNSPTFGKIFRLILKGMDGYGVIIPVGFAHAIFAHEDSVVMTCCDNKYAPEQEKGINWKSLKGLANLPVSTISDKDIDLPHWSNELANEVSKF
jgi:dTDP-4-dehydrorhamnose 3,5-epimerase